MYDAIIIGLGPSGLQAAIYLARANLNTLIFGKKEKANLWKAHYVDNYFGFEDGIKGEELLDKGIKHAQKFGAKIIEKEITLIKVADNSKFEVTDEDRAKYTAKNLIFATGLSLNSSGIQNEEKFIGKGLSYCAACDGYFFKNKKIAVVGNKHFACEMALELLSYSKDVSILSNGSEFEFSEKQKIELNENNIQLIDTEKLKEFVGEEKLQKINDINGKSYLFDGVFMALGVAGADSFARELGIETNGKYIKVDKECKTNIPNIYAVGDCCGSYPQIAKSVGEGAIAALTIIKNSRK